MKIKTPKSFAKRIKITKGKKKSKLIMKKSGQDHFNSREKGKVTRQKRRNITAAKSDVKNLKRLLPYA